MKISVVIPTFNRCDFVSRAIDSVLEQTLTADEILVIDDGSTDDTGELIIHHYPGIKYIYQKNSGVSAARNTGISRARNDWIALLDSDDSWHRQKLEIQSRLLAVHSEYKICHCNETWIKNGKEIRQLKKHQKRGGYIFEDCLPLCVISPSSVIFHRDIVSTIGLFDESLPACEDYDFWLRICSRFPVLYSEQKLVNKYGGHADQLSGKYWGMDRFRIRSLQKLAEGGDLTSQQQQRVSKMLAYKLSIYIKGARKHGNKSAETEFKTLANKYLATQ